LTPIVPNNPINSSPIVVVEEEKKEEEKNPNIEQLHFMELENLKIQHTFAIQSMQLDIARCNNNYSILESRYNDINERLNYCTNNVNNVASFELSEEQKKLIEVGQKIKEICQKTKTKECLDLFF